MALAWGCSWQLPWPLPLAAWQLQRRRQVLVRLPCWLPASERPPSHWVAVSPLRGLLSMVLDPAVPSINHKPTCSLNACLGNVGHDQDSGHLRSVPRAVDGAKYCVDILILHHQRAPLVDRAPPRLLQWCTSFHSHKSIIMYLCQQNQQKLLSSESDSLLQHSCSNCHGSSQRCMS